MRAVILCGGSGTRLWPISRTSSPKQFAQIFEGKSLFELTLQRNMKICDSFTVVVNAVQLPLCKQQIPSELDGKVDFIIEPVGRNTAPAIALAALASDQSETLLVFPSDHLIQDPDIYLAAMNKANELTENGKLVTFGISPKYPETGYGYIEANGLDVSSFKEKPDYETAKSYLEAGNYFWNSGMFAFKASDYLSELEQHSPEMHAKSVTAFNKSMLDENIRNIQLDDMKAIPADSIDYAIMEKSQKVNVVESKFFWSDLGSFDSLYDVLPKDEAGNTLQENFIHLNSKNNMVLTDKRIVSTFDVEDLIIVDTKDALLIGKKGEAQKVKELLTKVKETNSSLLE